MRRAALLAGRLTGFGLLGATAGIHLYLWSAGYSSLPTVGRLFLLNGIGASALAVAVLGTTGRSHRWAALAGAMLEAGTLVGLLLAVTVGLFGFVESSAATLFWQSVGVESAGTLVLLAVAGTSPGPGLDRLAHWAMHPRTAIGK